MSILLSTGSGKFSKLIPTRNYFIENARKCLSLKNANFAFVPGRDDYDKFAEKTLDLQLRGADFVLIYNDKDFDTYVMKDKYIDDLQKYWWFEFSSVYKQLDLSMLSNIDETNCKEGNKLSKANPYYIDIDFTGGKCSFVKNITGLRFAGCAIQSLDKSNVSPECKILAFTTNIHSKKYTSLQTIDGLDIEYLLAYCGSYDALNMPLLGIKNCNKLKTVYITQSMLMYDEKLNFDRKTPIYDDKDPWYLSKEKSAIIKQFVNQNTSCTIYLMKDSTELCQLAYDPNNDQYFMGYSMI